jgi:hypothetical protein
MIKAVNCGEFPGTRVTRILAAVHGTPSIVALIVDAAGKGVAVEVRVAVAVPHAPGLHDPVMRLPVESSVKCTYKSLPTVSPTSFHQACSLPNVTCPFADTLPREMDVGLVVPVGRMLPVTVVPF